MDISSAMGQSTTRNEAAVPPGTEEYSLPERGFAKHAISLSFQVAMCGVIALSITLMAHCAIPEVDWGRVTAFSGFVVMVPVSRFL